MKKRHQKDGIRIRFKSIIDIVLARKQLGDISDPARYARVRSVGKDVSQNCTYVTCMQRDCVGD